MYCEIAAIETLCTREGIDVNWQNKIKAQKCIKFDKLLLFSVGRRVLYQSINAIGINTYLFGNFITNAHKNKDWQT